mmetsp:Transcript_42792/g.123698  ORF Transcript_42792/g.123698 Transcript_42792/m.123698 type:complete len:226 (+) Transcript_42792:433-1110(+)
MLIDEHRLDLVEVVGDGDVAVGDGVAQDALLVGGPDGRLVGLHLGRDRKLPQHVLHHALQDRAGRADLVELVPKLDPNRVGMHDERALRPRGVRIQLRLGVEAADLQAPCGRVELVKVAHLPAAAPEGRGDVVLVDGLHAAVLVGHGEVRLLTRCGLTVTDEFVEGHEQLVSVRTVDALAQHTLLAGLGDRVGIRGEGQVPTHGRDGLSQNRANEVCGSAQVRTP